MKALRNTLAEEVGQKSVPLNIVQRWLGQARIETTVIFASAIGDEEQNLARRCRMSFQVEHSQLAKPNIAQGISGPKNERG